MYTGRVEEQVSLKLVINKETNKVLFAEAGKDFVDVLCSFLTFPLGTIARLVGQSNEIGCLNSLYRGVVNLDKECLGNATCKEMLLQPRNSSENFCRSLKLNIDDTQPTIYYMCTNLGECSGSWLSTFKNQRCSCGRLLDRFVTLKSGNVNYDGFVQGGATFIITDDLTVKPNSMETSFGIIQSFGIKNTSSVKQMTVNVTKKKVLDLLKCSLLSQSALTDLFLETKPFLQQPIFSPYVAVKNNNTTNEFQIKVKLFMRNSDGKILFAQGQKDFADFIFSLLTFPLGGVLRMLGSSFPLGGVLSPSLGLGCIDRLYKSMSCMPDYDGLCKYFMPGDIKNRLVDPSIAPQFKLSKQILPIKGSPVSKYYCYYHGVLRESVLLNKFSISSIERGCFFKEECICLKLVDPVSSTGSHGGCYVKGPAVFMATDDLVVTPMTPTSAMSLLDRLETPPTDLKEKIVTIGLNEGCSILKAALTSTSALTNGLAHLLTQVKEEK